MWKITWISNKKSVKKDGENAFAEPRRPNKKQGFAFKEVVAKWKLQCDDCQRKLHGQQEHQVKVFSLIWTRCDTIISKMKNMDKIDKAEDADGATAFTVMCGWQADIWSQQRQAATHFRRLFCFKIGSGCSMQHAARIKCSNSEGVRHPHCVTLKGTVGKECS